MPDFANPSVRATSAALGACVIGALGVAWIEAVPARTPVEQFLDARAPAAMLLIVSGIIGGIAWWTVGRGWRGDRRRRRGAALVGGGTLLGYACMWLAFSRDDPLVPLTYVGIAGGLALALGAAAWWASLRALVAALIGAWIVAVVALTFDIGWMLSDPYVEPFEPCFGGMDCFGAGPSTPLGSGWIAFGAIYGMLWLSIPLVVAIAGGAIWKTWRRRVG